MSELQAIARLKIHEGKLEEFKALATRCMESVRTRDSGTLRYDWFFNADHSECVVYERYRDSADLIEHGKNLGETMNALLQTCSISGEILGTPSPALMQTLEGVDVRVYSPYQSIPGRTLVSITPFFIVKDLQVAIAFYRERLGFRLDFQGPDDDVYYARVSRDGVGIFLKAILPDVLPSPNHTRHGWARWDAYIYTVDPDALFAEFRQRGVPFVQELSFIDEGLWGFEITDADGYVLAFFQLRNA